MELIPSLLEREGTVITSLAEFRRRLSSVFLGFHMIEEGFVRTVDPLRDILDCLTAKLLPVCIFLLLFQFRKENLESIG
jgi:hypothetical protein